MGYDQHQSVNNGNFLAFTGASGVNDIKSSSNDFPNLLRLTPFHGFLDDHPLFVQNALIAADAATFCCTSRSRTSFENERPEWIHKMPGSRFGRIMTRSSDEPTRNSDKCSSSTVSMRSSLTKVPLVESKSYSLIRF
jgi:hypothetical protein